MTSRPLLTIVLAAGKGTRMKSAVPKVLHRVGGLSLIGHVLTAIRSLGQSRTAFVIGPNMEGVRAEVAKIAPEAEVFVQEQQLGTAHAVLAARTAIARHDGDVLVVFGDTPFITPATLEGLLASLDATTPVAVLGFHAADPNGYGRLIFDGPEQVSAIREQEDATEAEREITFCNSGVMAFRGEQMLTLL